ncbi:MAG: flagellar basal-body rod protein FlgF [Phenylobacterium sp.]|uniref:flagellar basal-body rod protein FlgF n=1 Tax=Phenylobacterium sp. TaxID=1871053 RepID=UPI0025DFDC0A|nr:flagellar basal-body rod protein FlgF [Phenylobacterium sp.]MCG9917142.1 flagellar basal-body rod protein FlgF [Phenylobacterium sp.]
MDNAVYVGLSRQMVLRRELDLIANNVANANTVGFKVESLLARTEPGAPASNDGAPRPVKFVLDGGVARDFTQGGLFSTGSDLDVGIEGDGFFEVATDEGPRYTRDGRFTLDELGRITTQAGDPVAGEGGGEIIINPENGAVTIGPDGTISQGENLLGRIAVMRFDDLSVLQKMGDNLLSNTSNQQPQAAPDVRVRQGMLENSNVKPILEITRLIEVTRAYESITRMMESSSDLSRRAVERMGRAN